MERFKVLKAITFALTDAGLAERLELIIGPDWKYAPAIKRWLHWTGQQWQETEQSSILVAAVEALRALADEIAKLPKANTDYERKARAAVLNYIEKAENANRCRSALAFLEGMLHADYSDFDRDPLLLNVRNGVLDLKTCKLRPHKKEDLLTKICATSYVTGITTSLWHETVMQILPDPSIRRWLQKFCGYCLTGSTEAEKFVIAYGPGGCGKGTFFETIAAALGDYKAVVPIDILLANGIMKSGDQPTPELAKLPGKRYVISSESGKGRRLDEAKVKLLTGGDVLTARRIGAQPFEFRPCFKLILQSNFLPSLVDSTDEGIKRRLVIVPFTATIPNRNTKLKQALLSEANLNACLAWLVEGCKIWQTEGLEDVPPEAAEAAAKFYAENDVLQQWLDARTENSLGFLQFDVALKDFNRWQLDGGGNAYGRKSFSEAMERHGKQKTRQASGVGFLGLALRQ